MLANERQRRQKELTDMILYLSKELLIDNEIRANVLKLKDIYVPEFRHNYSEIYPVLVRIERKGEKKENLECLATNLESMRNYVENEYVVGTNEFITMQTKFDKLCDHVNLEISRINYHAGEQQDMVSISRDMDSVKEEMKNSTDILDIATKKADNLQTELVSVLGIFAAIMIAFSGGLNLIGSVFSGMNDSHICRVILLLFLCGFILFNTIFLLMFLIGKFIGKSVFVDCRQANSCQDIKCINLERKQGCKCEKKCYGLTKIRKRLPYVFYFNVLILLLGAIDIIIWYLSNNGYI